MYNTYLYTVANEGVDSEDTYSYKGKVNSLKWPNYCIQIYSLFLPAILMHI